MTLEERRARSGLKIVIPQIEPWIAPVKNRYTQSGPSVPAHVTLLSPFYAPSEVTDLILQRVERVISQVPPFEFTLKTLETFPKGILYISVEPREPFSRITRLLAEEFPEMPLYGGEFPDPVPHVTVVDFQMCDDPVAVKRQSEQMLSDALPMGLVADRVVWMQRIRSVPAPWDVVGDFPLGRARA
jgi:2'-5' RNA ligase